MSVNYSSDMRLILLKSEYFKVWMMHNLQKWQSITDLEDLMLLIGVDVESTLSLNKGQMTIIDEKLS